MIYTVIAKPTKACNADCSYCSSPPDDANSWTIEDFKLIFDRVSGNLSEECYWIWHGGEPMLQGADFYRQAYSYAIKTKPNIKFSMQTNILLYKSKLWKDIFKNIFEGRVSTSFDPDVNLRTIKGDAEKYERQFKKKLSELLDDGFEPLVISVFNQKNAEKMQEMYDWANSSRGRTFHIRFNYQYPAGRASELGDIMSPETYGTQLLSIYNKWIIDRPAFDVVPMSQMMVKVIGKDVNQCPWTNSCGGKFLSIEPNGDLYNCGDFADLGDEKYRFGNVRDLTLNGTKKESIVGFVRKGDPSKYGVEIMSTPAAVSMIQRRVNLPSDCFSCRHYAECQGGCMRDAELYGRGLGGKFYYCASWKMVFDRIKESILSGEADGLLSDMGHDPQVCRDYVFSKRSW
jgi:radical SAM protein with 4Fe4S-binding SPASM domain